jgi:hypothetical protein
VKEMGKGAPPTSRVGMGVISMIMVGGMGHLSTCVSFWR